MSSTPKYEQGVELEVQVRWLSSEVWNEVPARVDGYVVNVVLKGQNEAAAGVPGTDPAGVHRLHELAHRAIREVTLGPRPDHAQSSGRCWAGTSKAGPPAQG